VFYKLVVLYMASGVVGVIALMGTIAPTHLLLHQFTRENC